MNIEFLATVAVITPDPLDSRNLYVEALGLPLQGEGDGYYHSEQIGGCKSFGIWPLPQAAQACFGTDQWPADGRSRRSASSSTLPMPLPSTRQHRSSSRPAMSYCMELAMSDGARRSLGCSRPRARSSASPTPPSCTTDFASEIRQSLLRAVTARRDLLLTLSTSLLR